MIRKVQALALGLVGVLAGVILASCNGELAMAPAMGDVGSPSYGVHHTQRMAVPRWMTRPCAQEDSVNCYWDASASGNLQGHSFYVVTRRLESVSGHKVGRVVCVFYVKRADAKRWDACHVLPRAGAGF